MFRHPGYLDIPWNLHWHSDPHTTHHFLWWVIAVLTFFMIFLVGVGVTSGILTF